MKFIHTADWHLGNTFHGHDRSEEHHHFLKHLLDLISARRPDALIVAGDIFDTPNPSARAEAMLYDFLLEATSRVQGLQIVLIAGNHDSGSRLEAPAALLKSHNVYVRGTVRRKDNGEPDFTEHLLPLATLDSNEAVCVCHTLPFLRTTDCPPGTSPEEALRLFFKGMAKAQAKSDFKGLPVIVAAHFYASGAEICAVEHSERIVIGGQEAVNVNVVGKQVSYAALGHIHKPQTVGGEMTVCYSGSPLPLSFSELHYRRGVNWVEIDADGEVQVEHIPYSPLRTLISIPESGDAASVDEVFSAIEKLPARRDGVCSDAAPYVELKIREEQPEPWLMHDLLAALEEKDVRFCRVLRRLPNEKKTANDDVRGLVIEETTPLDLAQRIYSERYEEAMPTPLKDRFLQATERALQEQGEEGSEDDETP